MDKREAQARRTWRVRTLQAALFVVVGTAGLVFQLRKGQGMGLGALFLSIPFLLALVFLASRTGLPFGAASAWGGIGYLACGVLTFLFVAALSFLVPVPWGGLLVSPGGWLILLLGWPAALVGMLGCLAGATPCG